jgi:hypothetical protein
MINEDVVQAYNNRLTANLNNIKTMTPAQKDRVKGLGTAAENLLKNRDFAQFVHQFKFDRCDALADIKTHTEVDNAGRIAISNQIAGVDEFVALLQRAVFFKNRVIQHETSVAAAQDNTGNQEAQ